MKTTTYHVNIVGTIWQGCRAVYSYSFDHLPTAQEIKHKAGDFSFVEDYEITAITHSGDWKRETTTRKVVREWENPDSEDFYGECA